MTESILDEITNKAWNFTKKVGYPPRCLLIGETLAKELEEELYDVMASYWEAGVVEPPGTVSVTDGRTVVGLVVKVSSSPYELYVY